MFEAKYKYDVRSEEVEKDSAAFLLTHSVRAVKKKKAFLFDL